MRRQATSHRAASGTRRAYGRTWERASQGQRSLAGLAVALLALTALLAGCTSQATRAPATPTAIPTPTVETPEMAAAQIVSQMSLDDKLGQLIIMQFTSSSYAAGDQALVQKYHPGGLILYPGTVIAVNAQQLKDLAAAGQKDSPIPMFTVLDLEGGWVDRLRQYLGWRMSAQQMAQAAVKDPTVPEQQGAKDAKDLESFGFNLDLAPDADVEIHWSDILNVRSFGSTPGVVINDAGSWLQGLQSNGVIGCLKHFPGIGAIGASADPHATLPVINRTKDQLEATEFAPFRALIQSGQAQCVMSTDVLVPSLDPNMPSELSQPTITGVLRNELHFNGIAITDALYMDGISARWSMAQAAVLAIEAGNDMVMAPFTTSQLNGIVQGLKAALSSGKLTQAQVDASVERILALKIRYHILTVPGLTVPPLTAPPTTPPASPSVPAQSSPGADVPHAQAA